MGASTCLTPDLPPGPGGVVPPRPYTETAFKLSYGVYKLDGDTLTVCLQSAFSIPQDFSDKKQVRWVLRRADVTDAMRAVAGRVARAHAGLDVKARDDAVEELHRDVARFAPPVFVPLVIGDLMRLAPRDTRTRVLLRRALAGGWLDEPLARVYLVKAGDDPKPHLAALLKSLGDAKTRRATLDAAGGLGADGAELIPPLKKLIADAEADPEDFRRAFRSKDDAPDHVLAYWALVRIQAAVKKAGEKR